MDSLIVSNVPYYYVNNKGKWVQATQNAVLCSEFFCKPKNCSQYFCKTLLKNEVYLN